MLIITTVVVQLAIAGITGCADGARAACSYTGCAVGERYCFGGSWDACQCLQASCDDGNPCTTDTVSNFQCVHSPRTGVSCNDNNACTTGDVCSSAGQCVGTAVSINDNNACTTDSCNTSTGVISHTSVNINDNNACTTDSCNTSTGAILHIPVNVDDGNECTADSCNPATGAIAHDARIGAACDDHNACTAGDACTSNKQCVGTAVQYADDDPCTDDYCDPVSGPRHDFVSGRSCNDGNQCTTNDQCTSTTNGNRCVGTDVVADDGDPCTVDRCDPSTGMSHTSLFGAFACTSQTKYCYDRFGRVTKKIVCVGGGNCASCPQ